MEKKRIKDWDAAAFPVPIRDVMAGQRVFDSSCSDAARVYYVESGLYVKEAPAGSLAHEKKMGEVFFRHHLGPEVVLYLSEGKDYLVTREVPGQDLCHHLDKPELLCGQMAEKLLLLHSLPAEDVPLCPGLSFYREGIMGEGQGFEKYVLMEGFPIRNRQEALCLAREMLPHLKNDTLIHGDACLPNMMMEKGRITSFIDFATAGRGDRHMDLFWALWSLQFNLKTEKYTDCLLDAYGKQRVNREMIRAISAMEALG